MVKKFLAVILMAALMLSCLTGCTNGGGSMDSSPEESTAASAKAETGEKETQADTTADTAAEKTTEETTAPENGEIVNLVVQIATLSEFGEGAFRMEEELNKMLEKDIGVHVTFEREDLLSTVTDATLALSSGEQLDVFISFANSAVAVESGLARPLDDLIDEYGADIKEQLGVLLDMCRIDGQLYGVTVNGVNADGYGYNMKKSYADKYGIERNVNKLYTLDEMEEIFEMIEAGEGPGTIMHVPWNNTSNPLNGDLVALDSFTIGYGVAGSLVLDDDNYDPAKIVNYYETDDYAEYCRRMYKWAQRGWISADAAVATDSADDLCKRDNVVGCFAYGSFDERLNQTVSWADEVVVLNMQQSYTTGGIAGMMWHVSAECKYPEKALEFLNYFYKNPDAFMLVQYGIEGEEWEVVKEEGGNKLVRFLSANPLELPYYIAYPWIGNQLNLPVFEPNDINMNEIKKAIADSIPASRVSPALGYSFDSSGYDTEISALSAVAQQYVTSLNAGAVDPDQVLPEFIAALKSAGIEEVIAENQRQLDEFLANK